MAPLLPSPRGSRSLAALLVASAIWAPAAMRDVQVGWQPGNGSTATGSVIRVGALVRRCGTLLLPCAGLLDYHMSFFTELNSRRGGVLIGGVAHPLQLEAADVSDDAPEEAVRVLVEEKGLRLVLGPLDPMISAVASHIVSQAGGVFVSPAAESGGSASPGIFTLGMPAARTFGSALRMFAGLGATSALFIHSDDAKDVEKCTAASSIAQSLGITTQEVSMFSGTWMEAGAVDVIVGCFREEQACYTWINVLSTSTVPHKAVVVDECPQYNDFLIRTQHNGQFVFSATLWPPDASVSSPLLNITNFGKARGYDLEGLTAMAAGEVLVTAIEAAGSVEPSAVTAAIQAGHFSTLVGSFRFNAAGAAEREAWVLQRQWSTQASVVSPPSLAVVAPRYPHPDYVARRCFSEGNKRTGSGLSDPGDVESCKRCPDGQEAFTPEGELFQLCRLCPAGSHAWSGTEMTCKQCLPGSFAEEAGQSRCDYCAAGRFMQDYNATACEDCPAGLVSRMEGQSQCEACIGNGTRYASRRGMAFCEECPEGATCEGDEQGNFVGMTNQLGWWHIEVQISPAKDVQTLMNIKAMAGLSLNSVQYHVFEIIHVMPKFAMYHCVEATELTKKPEGYCSFYLPERPARIWSWLQRSFINIDEQMQQPRAGSDRNILLDISFISLRTGEPLGICMTAEQGGMVTIRTDDIEVAGEMVQDLCGFLQVAEQESTANFPEEMEKFKSVLMKVDEYNAVRLKLTAEMADSANLVKALIVKAEDYRMLSDMSNLKKVFSGLQSTNSELIAEYNKRANNHQQLLGQLKEVNMMIQKAAKLRVGNPKTRVVAACRQAIKKNNIHELFQIIRTGQDTSGN